MANIAFVALKYKYPLERIEKTVERHRAYLRKLHGVRLVSQVVEVSPRLSPDGGFVVRPLWLRKGSGPLVRQPYPPDLLAVFEDEDIPYSWQDDVDEEEAA